MVRGLLNKLRRLNIHEYQGAKLMSKYSSKVPKGVAVSCVEEVRKAIQTTFPNEKELVVKCQILAGGRGLGKFTSGVQGGVHIVKIDQAEEIAGKMLGQTFVPKQTGLHGKVASKVAFQRRQYVTLPSGLIKLGGGVQIQDNDGPFTLIKPHFSPFVEYSWRNSESRCEILRPGMILLRNYITLQGQADIVHTCQKLGVGIGGFYKPRNASGDVLRLHMTCFGRNWDPVTRYENRYRSDGSIPPPVPRELVRFAKTILRDAHAHLDDLPSMVPDVCVVNYYSSHGRLGLHQDGDESSDSLSKGLPVISLSIGDTAEFWYGDTRDENKLERVLLYSGDVLIFGGKSRLIHHGVKKVYIMSALMSVKKATRLVPGRLNLTLRQL